MHCAVVRDGVHDRRHVSNCVKYVRPADDNTLENPTVDGKALEKMQMKIEQLMHEKHDVLYKELAQLRTSHDSLLGNLQYDLRVIMSSLVEDMLQKQQSRSQPQSQVLEVCKLPVVPAMSLPLVTTALPNGTKPEVTQQQNPGSAEQQHSGSAPQASQAEPLPPVDDVAPEEPKGTFHGRPNLYALMQAKNWDSTAADNPDSVCNAEVPEDTKFQCCKVFKRALESTAFEFFVGMMILANAVVMSVELEYEGMFSADAIGIERDNGNWPYAKESFHELEYIFTIFFTVELVLRLLAMGRRYFQTILNKIDFFIVVMSVLELYVFPYVGAEVPNMTFFRLIRMFKIMRVLRVVRVLKLFEQLRVLIRSIYMAMPSLFWSIALLAIMQIIGSIFMTQSLSTYLQNEDEDPEERAAVYMYFGTLSRSVITLFEMTLAIGTWGKCGRIIIFKVNRLYAVFFLSYLMFVSFAMIRIISAIFLKDTLAAASKDADVVMAELNKDPGFIRRLREIFDSLANEETGEVSLHHLQDVLNDSRACEWLEKLDIRPHEMMGLFTLMDDGNNELSFCEFLTGIMRMKTAARGVDIATLLYENKKILSRMLKIGKKVDELSEHLTFIQKVPGG